MKRRFLAAAWIAGATVPLLAATVLLVGCCVLPFHGVMHRLMPLCETAANVMRGGAAHHEHDPTPAPAREKQEPVRRIATDMPHVFRLPAGETRARAVPPGSPASYRSFITLGAVRCDRDVGLHVLVETFLI